MQHNKILKITIKSVIALCFILMLATNSYAVNMQHLKYSPVARFTPEDFEMLQTTAKKALNDNKNGVSSEWKNPESNNSGSITPLNTSMIDGMHCRKVEIINRTESKSGTTVFTFCKVGERWKVLK
ncbi:MAG: hypothetical protein KAI22_10045 [Gammaproteobacteria bacterium]|nr:hypothetical protein [Gammaproteobacteria bacterium]